MIEEREHAVNWARCLVCFATTLLGLVLAFALLTTLLLLHHRIAAALPASDNGVWMTYTITDGLPSDSVWGGVVIDGAGSAWAGFENGEWEYPLPHNYLVSQFTNGKWISHVLPGCRVQPLVAAEQVYIGSYCPGPPSSAGGGLSWFSDNTWVNFTPADGLAGTYVNAIAPEGKTRVWLTSGDNLYFYTHLNMLDHKGTATKVDDVWTVYELGMYFYSIAIDQAGNRWFGTNDGVRVLSADGNTWITCTTSGFGSVTDIAFDALGNTWLAGWQKVARFDGHSWTQYDSREEAIEANYNAIMTSLNRNTVNPTYLPGLWAIEGRAGVWIIRWDSTCGCSSGVGFYDGNTWTVYTTTNSGLGSDTNIHGIAVDKQGRVWFGTSATYPYGQGGVNTFTPPPSFAVAVAPNISLIEPGETAIVGITFPHVRGWVPTATLNVASLPPYTLAAFDSNPASTTADAVLNITTTLNTPFVTWPLTITAIGAETTHTATVTLLVLPEVSRHYLPAIFSARGPQ